MNDRFVRVRGFEAKGRNAPVATVFTEHRVIASGRCAGIELGDGNYSGCAIGDGEDPKKFGDEVCPACNNTGVAT